MPISMSGAKIDSSERESLLSSQVDSALGTGGSTPFMSSMFAGSGQASGAPLAGITPSFASNVSQAIDTYSSEVRGYLDAIENANSEVAFKGPEVKAALGKFITSIKEVANSYLEKLNVAETQIIESVGKAYGEQDTSLAGDMDSDSASVEGSVIS